MKKTLYLNCFSGISGDMTLGVLLDLLGREDLETFLEGLALKNYEVGVSQSKRRGITGLDVRITPGEDHPHRGLTEILEIIGKSAIGPGAAEKASETFRLLAEAEGAVHGVAPEKVHFHEVGAVDSIVDIVGACVLLEALDPSRVVISPINVGSGTVKCAHGEMPVPAPATAKLLEGVPVFSLGDPMERTTPTGAALARVFASGFGPIPAGVMVKTGYGLGDADTELANVLQGTLLEEIAPKAGDSHRGHGRDGHHHRH